MNILLTGGLGYIGSHTAVTLIEAGHEVVLLDNLANSKPVLADRIAMITGVKPAVEIIDVLDLPQVEAALRRHRIEAVIHLAGSKAIKESARMLFDYERINVAGSITLLYAMLNMDVRTFVFSSSAAVYGEPRYVPLDEAHPLAPINPYGRGKLKVEWTLTDLAAKDPSWRIAILRYFNPVGAHPSALIGENPQGTPSNLMPFITRAAAGLQCLKVFGQDYPTPDGTAVRDYLHVMDLAEGHHAVLEYLQREPNGVCEIFNMGSGRGVSVLELIQTFERATGQPVPFEFAPRRPGDVAIAYANVAKAERLLGWRARHGLEAMCQSAWDFFKRSITQVNP